METLSTYKSNGLLIYYKFECDDINKPNYIAADCSFDLYQVNELDELMVHCKETGIDFDLYIEVFNQKTNDILIKQELL